MKKTDKTHLNDDEWAQRRAGRLAWIKQTIVALAVGAIIAVACLGVVAVWTVPQREYEHRFIAGHDDVNTVVVDASAGDVTIKLSKSTDNKAYRFVRKDKSSHKVIIMNGE